MKKLFNLAKDDKIHKKNICMFREASYFMKVMDSDKSREDPVSVFRNQLVDIARYGRSGLFLAMDSQDAREVGGLIDGQDDLMIINEMPSHTSREATCDPLYRDRRMNKQQIIYIATMPVHQVCLISRGERAVILKRIQPPRCKYWKVEYGNFMSQWKKEINDWVSTEHFLNIVNELNQRNDDLLLGEKVKLLKEESDEEEEKDEEEEEEEEIHKYKPIKKSKIKNIKDKEEVTGGHEFTAAPTIGI